jgi:putative methionine-R-sulfoxide reductase with GAF domain
MLSSARRLAASSARRLSRHRIRSTSTNKGDQQATSATSSTGTADAAQQAAITVEEPTRRQLLIVAVRSAIPMVGFGFMDNIVMIQAGDLIDNSIGVTFGLSTLTAAGFGQCVSDVAGFTSGGIVDAAVSKLNLPTHGLTQAQLGLRSARIYHTAGGCVGVVAGCLLGMCSLFFMDTDKKERERKAKELKTIFETVTRDGSKLVRADRCSLWMHDEETHELWTQVASGTKRGEILRIPDNTGVAGAAVQDAAVINIPDAYEDSRFNPEVDRKTGYRTRSIIAVPIMQDGEDGGRVIGCIQMVNKKNADSTDGVFDENDAKLLRMLSNHVKAFTKIVTGDD